MPIENCRSVALALLLAGAWISLATNARAQTESAAPQAGQIEEVIVTAQRRSELLSRVPASVSAFTAERMETLDVKDFSDLVRYTPGVDFDPETDNISIRGVNSTAGDATTGLYIDDTPIQLRSLGFGSDNTLPNVFDLDRVEVLRGPQGTLFGAGSEGGTVRYITPQPSLTDYSVYAKSEISDTWYGAPSYEAGVAVGGPIVDDKLGFRISGWARHDGGYIDHIDYLTGDTIANNDNWSNTYVVHAALAWQPTAQLTVTPSVFFQNRHVNNDDEYWVGLSNPGNGDYKNATPEKMGDRDRFVLPSLKIDYALNGAELISNTSYFDRDQVVQDYSGTLYNLSYFQSILDPSQPGGPEDPQGNTCKDVAPPCQFRGDLYPLLTANGINLPGFGHYESTNYITNRQRNFTQEVRLQSNDSDSPLSWILGMFYTHQNQLSVEEINDPQLEALTEYLWGETIAEAWAPATGLLPNGDDYINDTKSHEWQFAVFANATYAVTDQLKLQAGVRLARTHFDFTNFSDGPQNFGPLTLPGGGKDEKPVTPMGSITYQFTPDDMAYFTIAKGYRIGGANPPFPVNACSEITSEPLTYDSDSVVSYEAGTKDKFLHNTVQLSGSVYYLKWSNIQQDNYLPSCGFKYTANEGSAESKGFDLEGEWLVTDALDLDFSLGYIDAHYTDTTIAGTLLLANQGDKLPGSPWTASVGAQYTKNVWGRDSFFRLDYTFASRETGLTPERDPFTSSYDAGLEPEPATNVLMVRAGTTLDRFAVSVFADNLLNSHPQLNLSHQDADTLLYEAETLRPRTVGLTMTYRY